ncbi:tetratricopeptide repeat protein [Gammaproteobacteria bacterium]|nr:tetratricopeptide repeat protein [Gammaproteobacteria bacterium]
MRLRNTILFGLAFLVIATGCVNLGKKTNKQNVVQESNNLNNTNNESKNEKILPIKSDALSGLIIADLNIKRGNVLDALTVYVSQARATKDKMLILKSYNLAKFRSEIEIMTEMADLWLAMEPDNPSPHLAKIENYLFLKEPLSAISHGLWIYNFNGDINPLIYIISQSQNIGLKPTELISIISTESQSSEIDHLINTLSGIVSSREGDLEKAEVALEKAFNAKPYEVQTTIRLAQVLIKKGKLEEAISVLSKSVTQNPDNLSLRQQYAEYLSVKNIEQAISELELINNRNPFNRKLAYMLASLYLSKDETELAKPILENLGSKQNGPNDVNFHLGNIAKKDGEIAKAIYYYSKVISGSKYIVAQERLVDLYTQNSTLAEIQNYLSIKRERNPKYAKNLFQLESSLLLINDEKDKAFKLLTNALSAFPNDANLLYLRSMSLDSPETFDEMETDLRSILTLDGNNSVILNALGYSMLIYTERTQEAYDLIKKAHDLNPKDPAIIDSLGWVLFKLGKLEEALNYLNDAYALNKDAEIAAHLGEVLWVLNKREQALLIFRDSYENYPEHKTLLRTIEKLGAEINSSS